MNWIQIFWKVLMIIGIILLIEGIIGNAILASLIGPQIFLIAGIPQIVISILLIYFGNKYSK